MADLPLPDKPLVDGVIPRNIPYPVT